MTWTGKHLYLLRLHMGVSDKKMADAIGTRLYNYRKWERENLTPCPRYQMLLNKYFEPPKGEHHVETFLGLAREPFYDAIKTD